MQTLLWSRMTCSSTVLKYPLAVLAQTPAAYILKYCHAFSTTFTAVRCFQLRKKLLRLDATSYQSSERTVQHLCLWLQNSTSGSSAWNSHLTQGGRTTMMTMLVNQITSQCKTKLSQKYCPWINFNEWVFFSWLLCFALQYMFIQFGSQTWASLSLVPPGWGANSSQSCRSCSFSGHKQRYWTVLSELRYTGRKNGFA